NTAMPIGDDNHFIVFPNLSVTMLAESCTLLYAFTVLVTATNAMAILPNTVTIISNTGLPSPISQSINSLNLSNNQPTASITAATAGAIKSINQFTKGSTSSFRIN